MAAPGSSWVPEPERRDWTIPPLIDRLRDGRKRLVEALHTNDVKATREEWTRYDSLAAAVEVIHRDLGQFSEEASASVRATMARAGALVSTQLSSDGEVRSCYLSCSALETPMAILVGDHAERTWGQGLANRTAPDVAATYVRALDALRTLGVAFAATLREPTADSDKFYVGWTAHGFDTVAKLLAHRVCEIPQTMRVFYSRQCVAYIKPDSALLLVAWEYLGTTALGRRLGSLARYSFASDDKVARSINQALILEQLLAPVEHSLLAPDVHAALTDALQNTPCASLSVDARPPMVLLLYSLCILTVETAEIRNSLELAVERINPAAVRRCAQSVVDRLHVRGGGGGSMTRRELENICFSGPYAVLELSRVWLLLARKVSREANPWDTANMLTLGPRKRQFLAMISRLWYIPEQDNVSELTARILFWKRYMVRGSADTREYWKWTFARDEFFADLNMFSAVHPWVGESHWAFDINSTAPGAVAAAAALES